MVGGNGPNVTWRLAAKYADELNVDGMSPADVAEALPVIRSRCEEIGRDPDTLAISVHIWKEDVPKEPRVMEQLLADYAAHGVDRVMTLVPGSWDSDEPLEMFAAAARASGAEMA